MKRFALVVRRFTGSITRSIAAIPAALVVLAGTSAPLVAAPTAPATLDAPSWVADGGAHSLPNPGDGIFAPRIAVVAPTDKTGRPFTVEVVQPEPGFAALMSAGKPTLSRYVIKFPSGDAGGDCTYTGRGRYFIESTNVLTFQIMTACGTLMRGYNFMICMLNQDLRCAEAPWWYFSGRTYAISSQGISINGGSAIAWLEADDARAKLDKVVERIKAMRNRTTGAGATAAPEKRSVTCRYYHPETRSYELHIVQLSCAIRSLCAGMPDAAALRDGELIDWNSPLGSYVRKENKVTDSANWACWVRVQ